MQLTKKEKQNAKYKKKTRTKKQNKKKLSVQFSPNTFLCLLEIGILEGQEGERRGGGGNKAIVK